MEDCVATDPNKIDFTFFWTQLTASGPVAWLAAVAVTMDIATVPHVRNAGSPRVQSLVGVAWRGLELFCHGLEVGAARSWPTQMNRPLV
jgi:hypothetical protein